MTKSLYKNYYFYYIILKNSNIVIKKTVIRNTTYADLFLKDKLKYYYSKCYNKTNPLSTKKLKTNKK